MIQINKGVSPPRLAQKNVRMLIAMKAEFDAHTVDYLSGTRKFTFSKGYNTKEVKDALITCQNNKCIFSEAKFVRENPPVEHFRPKGRVDPHPNGDPQYPGYYWLAYDWSNLFLCKAAINTSNKRNYFPLENERNRTHHETNIESTLLIDCSLENPRDYIRFANDEPRGIDANGRGKFNITFFKLRHPEFEEARLKKMIFIKIIKDLVDKGIAEGKPSVEYTDSIEFLRETMSSTEEFSSMAIDFLSGWPPLA